MLGKYVATEVGVVAANGLIAHIAAGIAVEEILVLRARGLECVIAALGTTRNVARGFAIERTSS